MITDVIACPKCKGSLIKRKSFVCTSCKLTFLVKEGVPNMLLEDACSGI